MRCGRSDPCRVRVGALSTKHANEFLASTKCMLNERIHQQEEYLEAQWRRVFSLRVEFVYVSANMFRNAPCR